MRNSENERKAKRVLKDPKLVAIKAILEKDHVINCLLLLYMDKGKWKDAKDFMMEMPLQ